jgi:hypothetical protein
MNEDPLSKAKRALQASQPRRSELAGPPPNQLEINRLLAKAREAAEDRPRSQFVAEPAKPAPAPQPGPQKVRAHMICEVTGGHYIGIAERRKDELLLVGHEVPRPGNGGAGDAQLLSGEYVVTTGKGWRCPLCQDQSGVFWVCGCPEFRGALHCKGAAGRLSYCACGRREKRNLNEVPTLAVRGESVVTASSHMQTGQVSMRSVPVPGASVPVLSRKR